ncbi:hypothetical protein GCM10009624_14390 [Gordonia sinesedis]
MAVVRPGDPADDPTGDDRDDSARKKSGRTDGDRTDADRTDADRTDADGNSTDRNSTGTTASDRNAPDRHASYDDGGGRLSPALIATLVTIPIMVLVGFIAFAAVKTPDNAGDTPIQSYAAESSAPAECAKFLAALPDRFTGFDAKQIEGAQASWGSTRAGGPLTVRCGVTRPAELTTSSALQEVFPVQWFLSDNIQGSGQAFVAVDHRPYVAIWIPVNAGNAPISDVSAVIDRTLPRAPLDFG